MKSVVVVSSCKLAALLQMHVALGAAASATTIVTLHDPIPEHMPKVGNVFDTPRGAVFVKETLAVGPFSCVYQVRNSKDRLINFAMKCEFRNYKHLRLDVLILKALQGKAGFPEFIWASRTDHFNYVLMQLVGPDLGKLRRSMPQKKFTTPTAMRIIHTTLQRLRDLHEAGWLCRDVKAPNFAVGKGDDMNTIYMLDFGFAKRYRKEDGSVFPPLPQAAFFGTFLYAPMASHEQRDQGRKDDLESWFYMSVEALTGNLPWTRIHGDGASELILAWKKYIRKGGRAQFMVGVPPSLQSVIGLIDAMSFETTPNYDEIFRRIEAAAKELRVSLTASFDWQVNPLLVQRAQLVGEIGQSDTVSARLCHTTFSSSELDDTQPTDNSYDIELPSPVDNS